MESTSCLDNLVGEAKVCVEALLIQLGEACYIIYERYDSISEMFGHAREAAMEVATLTDDLEEEQSKRVTLEDKYIAHEESFNLNISKLFKERDHALALTNVLKKEKLEFGVGHDRLNEGFEKLKKEHEALLRKFSTLSKSHEQLQTQLTKDVSTLPASISLCSTNSRCEHGYLLKENKMLKATLEKGLVSCI